jgi:replicative DNA helicase
LYQTPAVHLHCFSCGKQKYDLTDDTLLEMELNLSQTNLLQMDAARPHIVTEIKRGVITTLEDRSLTKETAEKYRVEKLFDETDRPIGYAFNYWNEDGTIYAQKVKKLNKMGMQWNGVHDTIPGLFGQSLFPSGGKFITITEGEEDAMAAYQILKAASPSFEPVVVSIVDGAASVEKCCKKAWEYINSFENIILSFDGDEAGIRAAEKISKLFNYRPKVILFSEAKKNKEGAWELKDANDYLKANRSRDFINMWWKADKMTPKGVLTMKSMWQHMIKKDSNTCVSYPWAGATKMLHGLITGHFVVIKAGVKVGKCFGKDTPVRMFDGSVKMVQYIAEGDLLMGDDSSPRKVMSLTSGKEELFKVHQKKRDSYVVNKSHILCVKNTVTKELCDIDLVDYLALGKGHDWKGYAASVDRGTPFFEDGVLSPYYLGLWLGDGTSDSTNITNLDPEVINYLQDYAIKCGLRMITHTDQRNGVLTHSLTGVPGKQNIVTEGLKRLGVFKNKHIPKAVLLSPMAERLSLLAGLLDTDGHLAKMPNGSQNFEITQKNQTLALGIQEIARSCGFRCSVTEIRKSCWYLGEYKKSTYQRLIITGDLEKIPTKIVYKQAAPWREKHRDPLIYGIEIESIGEGHYYGFVLEGNHRFLLEDFTVVHNTSLLKEIAYHIHTTSPHNVGLIFLENTKKEIGLGLCALHMNKPIKPWEIPDDLAALATAHEFLSQDDRITIFDPEDSRTVENIMAKILYFVKAHNCRYILLDHITMLSYQSGDDNERRFIDKLCADLKELTTSLDICIIAVTHVNDDGKARGSRASAQLCDSTIMLERDKTSDDPIVKNTTKFIVEDNRWGECGTACNLFYNQTDGRMTELDFDLETGADKERTVEFDK